MKVKNTGAIAGQEIIQLYLRDVESSVYRPEKELKGFAKVSLEPGEEKTVTIELNERSFAFYNPDSHAWQVESGKFEILVGASSRDIRLLGTVTVTSAQAAPIVDRRKLETYFNFPKGTPVNQADFESLLGRTVPPNRGPQKGDYTLNTPIGDMADSFTARQLYKLIKSQMSKIIRGQEDTPIALLLTAMLHEMPIRAMLMVGDGPVNREMLESLLMMINGRFFKGFFDLIKSALGKK